MRIDDYLTDALDDNTKSEIEKFREVNCGFDNADDFTILYATDLHYHHENELQTGALKKLREMVEYSKIHKVDLFLLTGDITNGHSPLDEILYQLSEVTKTLQNAEAPIMICKGNHDANTWYAFENDLDESGWLSKEQWYKNVIEKNVAEVQGDSADEYGGYFYMDFPAKKIRVVVLNTSDIPKILTEDGKITPPSFAQHCLGIGEKQLRWLTKSLEFDEEGWSVLFASHNIVCPEANPKRTVHNGQIAWDIIKAFKNKTAVTFKSDEEFFEAEVECDFTKNKSNEVLLYMYGHNHMDIKGVFDGITTVCTKDMMNAVVTADDGTVYCASLKDIPVICDEAVKNNSKASLEGGWEFIRIDMKNKTFTSNRFKREDKNRFFVLENEKE